MSTSHIEWNNRQLAYRSRKLIWIIAVLVVVIVAWAAWATLDEVVVGEGSVVPSQSVQTIQSLEGGLIENILVRQGDSVIKGQPLAVLDDTRFRASFQESGKQFDSLSAQKVRLEAELASVKVDNKQSVTITPIDIVTNDNSSAALFNAKANYYERLEQVTSELEESKLRIEQQAQAYSDTQSSVRTLQSSLTIVRKERDLLKSVVESGAVAEVELLKLNRDVIRLEGDLSSAKVSAQKQRAAYSEAIADHRGIALNFRTKAQGQLNEVSATLAQLNESRQAIADQLRRTQITSPVDATVKDVFVRTIGGVVRPGEPIMELVPKNSALIVEAKIAPKDIAFISVGLEATVKFSAYDFVIYGGQKGKVTYVSADALQTEDGAAYYRAHIELDQQALEQKSFTVIPGMQAAVDILTGEKTVLSYWLKPILRAKQNSLRER
ncbi:HlyD family type I secretion periplasmic adaptor subunit [Vibrio sp. ER1A]|uniref:HlyD family type I secretion periplasmic adaptor subunit n=1 Tax=Vibrio sp. ER1A TaxID=1517681 RepID=UPI0004DD3898|nr:HlyD family type I secretion periplasmic adaptor subunit [Vibrio sp. ER1A]KFA97909.1 hemolysin D [Vibrio sp. ER1A]